MPSLKFCLTVATALLTALPVDAGRFKDFNIGRRERKKEAVAEPEPLPVSDFRFLNAKTEPFRVKSLPNVKFDLGEMYAGNIAIDEKEPDRALFFIWQPTIGKKVDEVVIWLNGGPGCSSLEGFFQENGLFTWQPGTFAPVRNFYSWVNETNMLWVEQPVGTGFATGEVRATTEEETAQDFIKFFKNFQTTFGIKNFKIYVTGESYAGRYIPYISAAMLDEKNTEFYDLTGAIIYDPVIGDFSFTQEEVVAVPFVQANKNLFNFDGHLLHHLESQFTKCGYEKLINKYLTFPPPGHQPPKFFNFTKEERCDVFDLIFEESLIVNPCFDIYEINSQCPILDDVLSFPTTLFDTTYPTYFNRADVKKAIHAPQSVDWRVCSRGPVYIGGPEVGGRFTGGPQGEGDLSADPIQKVLPQVIEATNRVLVSNGDFDMIIISQGTLMAIQNMSWHGKIGFQTEPTEKFIVPLVDLQYADLFNQNGYGYFNKFAQGEMGIQHFERGLMWVETFQSGHMQPEYQSRASFRYLQWMLRRIETL